MLFSERYGYKSAKSAIQFESMDEDLRNGLWNGVTFHYWELAEDHSRLDYIHLTLVRMIRAIWVDYFKSPVDTLGNDWTAIHGYFKNRFYSCDWYEVYDFLDFIAAYEKNRNSRLSTKFQEYCNVILKREVSAYRFVNGSIAPFTSGEEIEEIESALTQSPGFEPVSDHIRAALEMLSDRNSPDYRNSIKESISAVEALSKIISAEPSATLAQALKKIEASGVIKIHPALKLAFEKIYGYSNDADGIRHALLEGSTLDSEDAIFMLVACSAFVNYMRAKSAKAGIATK